MKGITCLIYLTLNVRGWLDWAKSTSTSREESLHNDHCDTVIMAAAARRFNTLLNTINACKNGAGVYLCTTQSSKWKISTRRVVTGLCIAVGGIALCHHCPMKGVDTTKMIHAVPVVFAREKVRIRKSGKGYLIIFNARVYMLITVWSSKQAVLSGFISLTLSTIQRCWKQGNQIFEIEISALE